MIKEQECLVNFTRIRSGEMPMIRLRSLLGVLALAVAFVCSISAAAAQNTTLQPADTILTNGKVYTVNAKQPWARAVAIRSGKIISVGDDAEILKLRGPATKVIDAGGKLVLPGFVDCHIHFLEGSISLGQANLEGSKNPADIQRILREYAAKHPGDGWILGAGGTTRCSATKIFLTKNISTSCSQIALFSSLAMMGTPLGPIRRRLPWQASAKTHRIPLTALSSAIQRQANQRVP